MRSVDQVTVVSVAYESAGILPAMLASVPMGTAVVVVDNGSSDIAALRALCARTGATLVENGRNLGFGAACNRGAARATTEFLLFLNPDAILTPEAIDSLVAAAARYPRASAFNPRLQNAVGKISFKRSSRLMPRSENMPRGLPPSDTEVTVLSGAALFVRKADFDAVGGFDEQIFLYHEDDDISRRLRRDRGPLMVIPDAVVEHALGESSPPSDRITAFKAWHMARSGVYAERKHNRPIPLARAIFFAVKNLFALDMLVSSHRRTKNWAYLKGVLSCVGDGGVSK